MEQKKPGYAISNMETIILPQASIFWQVSPTAVCLNVIKEFVCETLTSVKIEQMRLILLVNKK